MSKTGYALVGVEAVGSALASQCWRVEEEVVSKVEQSISRVAARIKQWRTNAGYSLQELANRSGVSPSTIHKIERTQTVPTIGVVLKLATGLGRHPTEFFDDRDDQKTTCHVKAADRNELVTPRGARLQNLGGESTDSEIGVWRIVHPPGFSFGEHKISHLHGELVLFVEKGQLSVTVGSEEFELETGDSLHFKGSSPYCWHNTSDQPVVALIIGNVPDSPSDQVSSRRRVFRASPAAHAGA